MKRKVISGLLVAAMASALLAGCGGTESSSGTESDSSTASGESGEVNLDAEISVKMCNTGCVVDDADRIEELINEITSESIGVTVDIEWISIGDYSEQINLMFSSQEACDLIMVTPMNTLSSMVNQDELMDISDYLDTYGQDIQEIAATYLTAYTSGDAVYGMPVYREKAGVLWLNMRKDILEELDLVEEAEAIDSWSDYYALLEKVQEAYPDMTMSYTASANNVGTFLDAAVYTAEDDWSEAYSLDNLGDSNNLVYVDEDGNVASYYTSELFYNSAVRAVDLYNTGYVNTDATTVTNDGVVQCKNGQCFSWIGGGESDNEATASLNSGYDILSVGITEETATTQLVTLWGFAVPYSSENPEAAVAFMNELYTNSELANLFVWGEEGVDWETTEDGYAAYVDGSDSSGYHSVTWATGNALLLTPWENSATVEDQEEVIANEVYSEYLGFLADTSELEQTITSCVNVVNEYRDTLYAGASGDNTDSLFEEMCDKLEAAGIQDIVDAYQEQLDAWLAEQ